MKTFEMISRVSKRFSYKAVEPLGDYDVYARLRGSDYLIATIRNRTFKRVKNPEWTSLGGINGGLGSYDYLELVQSYAGLNALESGKTGPIGKPVTQYHSREEAEECHGQI
jgi:hypothetical protein